MKKILLYFVFTVIMSLFFSVATVYAAPVYQVFLNGQPLTFKNTQPVNYNNRVMVPIREIGEKLGMQISYIEDTQIMIFSKPGYTIAHRMFTNSITVNNEPKTFDVASINRDNWTLMPVRMIAESIDAKVDYVAGNNGGSVYIITNSTPTVSSIEFSPSTVKSNESVAITVFANNQTSRMKLFLANGTLISEVTAYTTTSDGARKFVFSHTPAVSETSFVLYKAVPGNDTSYFDDSNNAVSRSVAVQALPAPVISDISIRRSTITLNDIVTFTVKANKYTEKIKITNDYNDNVVESSTFETSGDSRTFSIDIKAEKEGANEFKLVAANISGYVPNSAKSYTVDVMSPYAVTGLRIVSITPSPKSVRQNSTVTLTVVTSKSVNRVSILDSEGSSVANTRNYVSQNDYNATRTWELKVRMSTVGVFNYYVVAYEGSNSVDQRVQLECNNDASSKDFTIWWASSSSSTVKVNSSTTITVLTSTDIDWVALLDSDGEEIDYLTANEYDTVDTSRNEKRWVFSRVLIDKKGTNTFTARAYDIYDDYVSETINITGSTSGSSSNSSNYGYYILSVDTNKSSYYDGDTVRVEVETEKGVSSVEIYDEDDYRVASSSSNYSSNSNSLTWTLSFKAYGRDNDYYYTVKAKDSNSSSYDDYEFDIYINR